MTKLPSSTSVPPPHAAVLLLLSIPAGPAISMVTSLGNTDLPTMFALALLASHETRLRVMQNSQPAPLANATGRPGTPSQQVS